MTSIQSEEELDNDIVHSSGLKGERAPLLSERDGLPESDRLVTHVQYDLL